MCVKPARAISSISSGVKPCGRRKQPQEIFTLRRRMASQISDDMARARN